jgi:hypothetical protein
MKAGDIVTVWWPSYNSTRPLRVRIVSRYEHPAGNCWGVNIYDDRRKRFSKLEQHIGDEDMSKAEAVKGGAA